MSEQDDKPIFEVRPHGDEPFRIWADGRTEGFPEGHIIINRIPAAIGAAIVKYREARSDPAILQQLIESGRAEVKR